MFIQHEPDNNLLLILRAGTQRFLVQRAQIDHLGLVDPAASPADLHGRPTLYRHLGPLLEPTAPAQIGRCHAITIALRRRSVVLLADYIDDHGQLGQLVVQPLAPLLARRLARPWFLGTAICNDTPVLVLDLRQLATDIALGAV